MNNRPRLIDEATQGLSGGLQPPRVSIDGNRFTLVDPSGMQTPVPFRAEGPALDVVFIDVNPKTSKLYWGRPYQPGAISPPTCFSDNGVAPSSLAMEPQSQTCAACPHNAIGSATSPFSGKPVKACQDMRKLAVVIVGYPGAYLFTIKPGSFKNFTKYATMLKMQKMPNGGAPDLTDVVTRITFASQGVHDFAAVAWVPANMQEQIDSIWAKKAEDDFTGRLVGKDDVPATVSLPGMQQRPFPAAPVASMEQPAPAPFRPVAPPPAPPPPPQPVAPAQELFRPQAPEPVQKAPKRGRGRPSKDAPAAPPAAPEAPPWAAKAAAPTAEMMDRLDEAFKLPT
jgi:hypothetical protein